MHTSTTVFSVEPLNRGLHAASQQLGKALNERGLPTFRGFPAPVFSLTHVPDMGKEGDEVFVLDVNPTPILGAFIACNPHIEGSVRAAEEMRRKTDFTPKRVPKAVLGWGVLKLQFDDVARPQAGSTYVEEPKTSIAVRGKVTPRAFGAPLMFYLKEARLKRLPRERGKERIPDRGALTYVLRANRGSVLVRPFHSPLYAAHIDESLVGQNAILESLFCVDENGLRHLGGRWIACPRLHVSLQYSGATVGPLMPY